MHDHSRFQRDINDVTGVSLSLSLSLSQKSLTHNIGSASALPIILHVCFHAKSVHHIFDFVPANCRFYVDMIERLIRNNLKFRFTASSGELSPDEAVKRNVEFLLINLSSM